MRLVTDDLKSVSPRISKICKLGDSRTVVQVLKVGATRFNEWFTNRIGLVYNCMRDLPAFTKVIWGWVKSEDNIADIVSRTGAVCTDPLEGLDWQGGKPYLKSTESDWPIRTDIMEDQREMPKDVMKNQYKNVAFQKKHVNKQSEDEAHVFDRNALGTENMHHQYVIKIELYMDKIILTKTTFLFKLT